MNIPAEQLSAQAAAILRAWGLDDDSIAATVEVMLYADLRGIESHGVSTMTLYDEFRRSGKLTLRPQVRFAGDHQPDAAEIHQLHEQAHAACFIANSVKTEIVCEPVALSA